MKTTMLSIGAAAILVLLFYGPALGAWVDDGWSYRMSVTARPEQIDGVAPHVDFPLLLVLDGVNHPNVFAHAKSNGSDLLVTKGDGETVLSREVVRYDGAAQTAEIWVRADALSDSDNEFYLYYGNPDTSITTPASAAWKSNYRAVYHFAQDPSGGILRDSSPNAAHVFVGSEWSASDAAAGQIGQAWWFNGVSHHLQSWGISTQDTSYVLSGWTLNTSNGTDFFTQALPGFWKVSTQTSNNSLQPDYEGYPGNVRWNPNPILKDGNYHHFAWRFDGVNDTVTFHYDGEPQQPNLIVTPGVKFYVGTKINPNKADPVGVYGPMYFNNLDLMNGGGDEFRVHEGLVGEAWIRTEYRNQRDPMGFFVFGDEEVPGPTAVDDAKPTVVHLAPNFPNPFSGATSIRFHLPVPGRTRLIVYDVAGREVARLLDAVLPAGPHESGWNGRTLQGHEAAAGVYFLRLQTPAGSSSIKMLLQP